VKCASLSLTRTSPQYHLPELQGRHGAESIGHSAERMGLGGGDHKVEVGGPGAEVGEKRWRRGCS
jgi:hypothetical protein